LYLDCDYFFGGARGNVVRLIHPALPPRHEYYMYICQSFINPLPSNSIHTPPPPLFFLLLLVHLHGLGAEQAQVLQIPIHLVIIHPIPHGKLIREGKPHNMQAWNHRRLGRGCCFFGRHQQALLEEAHDAQGLGRVGLEERDELAEGVAGVDDVFHQDDVAVVEGGEVGAFDLHLGSGGGGLVLVVVVVVVGSRRFGAVVCVEEHACMGTTNMTAQVF
jgi:hypothetical protein